RPPRRSPRPSFRPRPQPPVHALVRDVSASRSPALEVEFNVDRRRGRWRRGRRIVIHTRRWGGRRDDHRRRRWHDNNLALFIIVIVAVLVLPVMALTVAVFVVIIR